MNRDDVDWKGYFAASPTPFTVTGALDEGALREVLDHLRGLGVHGVVMNGSTGEWWAQSGAERRRVAEIGVGELKGKVPVIIGITESRPAEVIELGRHAEAIGADGVMISPPPGSFLGGDEIVAFYRQVCASLKGPVAVFNSPSEIANNISPALTLRLAEIPNIVALKDAPPNDLQFIETLQAVGGTLRVFAGPLLSRLGLSLMAGGLGGDGYIGSACPLGRSQPRFFDEAWAGNLAAAGEIADQFARYKALTTGPGYEGRFGGYYAQIKAMMVLAGIPAGYPRPPRLPIEGTALAGLAAALREAGIALAEDAPPAAAAQ